MYNLGSVDIDDKNTRNFYFIFNWDIDRGDRFTVVELVESLEWWDRTRKSYTLPQILKIKKCKGMSVILSQIARDPWF
jgi:hypothetical protein